MTSCLSIALAVEVRRKHSSMIAYPRRTEAGAICALVRAAGQWVHAAFEESTPAQWLHDLLQPHAERVIVCNVRGERVVANQSDRIEADELSEKLRVGALEP